MPPATATLAALSPIDYGVVALALAAMLAVSVFFARDRRDRDAFLLGNRSLGWLPIGLSLAALLASSIALAAFVGMTYESGLRCWLIPASFWLILPLVVFVALPMYRGLALESIFDYLEQRFDRRVRRAAAALFAVWRLAWLAGALWVAGEAVTLALGSTIPAWAIAAILGLFVTLCTSLGGLRAVVWSGILQSGLILAGIIVVVAAVWLSISGGPAQVAETARDLGRLETANKHFNWTDPWLLWVACPHWLIAAQVFCVADQITVQRFLAAKDVNTARTSYFIGTLGLTFLLGGLLYVGLCLLAFYNHHPESLSPAWVVNLDGQTRLPILDQRGVPLLDANNPAHRITPENIERLVAERRILRPNDKLPFTSADELLDPATGRILVEKLAMFRPGEKREVILSRGAAAQLLPYFISSRLGWGSTGIAIAAILTAAAAVTGSGLVSLSTIARVDFASRHAPSTVAIGATVSLLSLLAGLFSNHFEALSAAGISLGSVILAVFLLGMLTRRTTAAAALLALFLGGVLSVVLSVALSTGHLALSNVWLPLICFTCTAALGVLLSFIIGRRNAKRDLRGLVLGCGTLGIRARDEVVPIIAAPQQQSCDV